MATPAWQDFTGIPVARGLHSFLNPQDSYEAAGKAENKGWDQAQDYQRPFWQQGQDQYGRLNEGIGNLTNPDWYNKVAAGYETSPYAQQLLKQNQASGLDAASSMGLNGSSAALGNIQQGAGNIVAKDRQQYLDSIMKNYMNGLGLGKDIYNTGATAGTNLGQQSMQHGENQAGLEYGRVGAPGKLFGQVAGTAMNYMKPGSGNAFMGGNNQFNPGQSG